MPNDTTGAAILYATQDINNIPGLTYSGGTFTVTRVGTYLISATCLCTTDGNSAELWFQSNQARYSGVLNFRTNLAITVNSRYMTCNIVFSVNTFDNGSSGTFNIYGRGVGGTIVVNIVSLLNITYINTL